MSTRRELKDRAFMHMASNLSRLSTCARRQVGCLLVDSSMRIIGTGYNGVPRGYHHCTEYPCAGARFKVGQGLEVCEAIHAEQNALLTCRNVDDIRTCYSTTSPCMHCVKLLANTGCIEIIFELPYGNDMAPENFWKLHFKSKVWRKLK